ncbi:hypothetical protein C2E23DRAFT_882282 [Lenzites betulinus]|nr:hypothetical protein C2E23DRAFT_882282 [Lenzites betulinus]
MSSSDCNDNEGTARTSSSQPIPEVANTRDEEFWYSDGNIILVARNVEFRVYRGLLSDHSPVFKDMFSLPQPDDASSSALDASAAGPDLCPVVHLFDSPEDLRHILRVYMPRTDTSPFLSEHPSFYMISAAARLGHKYQMHKLIEHAADYLKTHYTDDFDVWREQADYHPEGFEDVHAIGVVNLARLIGEPTLLPTALLICCGLESHEIVNGFEREDGSREQLTMEDIGRCFAAYSRLTRESVRIALAGLSTLAVSPQCRTTPECSRVFRHMLKSLDERVGCIVRHDVFYTDPTLFTDGTRLCKHCWDLALARDQYERRKAWYKLPQFLGIEAEFLPEGDDDVAGGGVRAAWPTGEVAAV